jgi:YhcH/YjgK/YiaL family protein
MIVDRLDNCRQYSGIHPLFSKAFEFLKSTDLTKFADGKHAIDGDDLFAIVARGPGRGRQHSPLEFHRRYIDIQFVVSGEDTMGWLPLADCQRISQPYDADKDLGFYFDRPTSWLLVPTGGFAIFFPEDAHAPLAGESIVHKVVLKIAV